MGDVVQIPMRAHTAPPGSRHDTHPRWADGTPVLIGQDVAHAKERWHGFVQAINADEVTVCWWMADVEDWTDGEEYAPDDLVRIPIEGDADA